MAALRIGLVFILMTLIVIVKSDLSSQNASPKDYALRVIDRILKEESQQKGLFLSWEYGGGLIFDAIHRASSDFEQPTLLTILDSYLTGMKADRNSYGYQILHNVTIPFSKAVGDHVPLFTIAFLNRYFDHADVSDLTIVNTVAEQYLLPYPNHLPDGTFSRHEGWGSEPDRNGSFIWADDQYMGLTLLCRIAKLFDRIDYAYLVARMADHFAGYLMDTTDGLSLHGYNDADQHHGCCKWGRANGWGMMTHVEVLEALAHFPSLQDSEAFRRQLKLFQLHAAGVKQAQSMPDGRWHQVLNESSTFLETSASAMFVSSIIRGMNHGWLDPGYATEVIEPAWEGLKKAIRDDGTVDGIVTGTGIGTNVSYYQQRSTQYVLSQPGLGSVIHALVDLEPLFIHSFQTA